MTDLVPPGAALYLGALLIPLLPRKLRPVWMLVLPVVGFLQLLSIDHGQFLQFSLFQYQLTPVRIDALSLVFGYIFSLAAFIMVVYSLHVRDVVQQVASMVYAGTAIGAVFAGDLITLFVYWELTAISSVFLIWASKSKRSYRSGMRYLIIQVGSGVLLMAGAILWAWNTGTIEFGHLGTATLAGKLIFLAFGIKCAFPLLHNWLQDAYPEATVTGTVFLSAFTTKLAVYALARGYAGTESLIWIGATMTAFLSFYAVIENDLRRVLAYSLNTQLGFMVVGIGIGTEMALNGTAAHAFTSVLYKALLFMSMGAVLYRTGTIKGSELGGLYKSMPYTTIFCIVGAASISGFPFFSGFISKSLIITAAADGHWILTWFVLLFASAGVFHHSGIRIPFFAFFAHDSGIRCKEAPWNMLLAMGATAFACVFIGIFPGPLYRIMPFEVDYQPYTTTHVVTQFQLLLFSALAFSVLMRTGLYPKETPSTNVDTDWIYRKMFPTAIHAFARTAGRARAAFDEAFFDRFDKFVSRVYRHYGPAGVFARTWATGSSVIWVLVLLVLFLVLYYS